MEHLSETQALFGLVKNRSWIEITRPDGVVWGLKKGRIVCPTSIMGGLSMPIFIIPLMQTLLTAKVDIYSIPVVGGTFHWKTEVGGERGRYSKKSLVDDPYHSYFITLDGMNGMCAWYKEMLDYCRTVSKTKDRVPFTDGDYGY
jgi:hypothetical protein